MPQGAYIITKKNKNNPNSRCVMSVWYMPTDKHVNTTELTQLMRIEWNRWIWLVIWLECFDLIWFEWCSMTSCHSNGSIEYRSAAVCFVRCLSLSLCYVCMLCSLSCICTLIVHMREYLVILKFLFKIACKRYKNNYFSNFTNEGHSYSTN